MAKIIKKKRRVRIEAFATLFFFVSIFLYLGSITALKSYNVVLSAQSESTSAQVSDLSERVATLEADVKELSSSDRIIAIAAEDNIKAIQGNVKLMSGQ